MTKDRLPELRSWANTPTCDDPQLLDWATDEIERLQKRLRVARNIIVDAQNFIHPTTVWRDTDLMQRNIDRFLADGRTSEPGAQPCAQQGGKLALNHDPTYSQPPSKSSVLRPSEPLLSAFKCSSCGKIADNSGDTVGWALCPCGSFRQPERTNEQAS